MHLGTDTQTDIGTIRLNHPWGRFSENQSPAIHVSKIVVKLKKLWMSVSHIFQPCALYSCVSTVSCVTGLRVLRAGILNKI